MKVSQIFHKLYMWVLMLPILIIPIFAINIMNKAAEPISVTTSGYEIRNKYESNEVNTLNDLVADNIYYISTVDLNYQDMTDLSFDINIFSFDYFEMVNTTATNYDEIINDTYDCNVDNMFHISMNESYIVFYYTNLNTYSAISYDDYLFSIEGLNFNVANSYLNDFKRWCQRRNYLPEKSDYQVLEYVYNEGIVLDNTDIGSQFIYSLYIPVHDYFNFGNFFGLNNMYNWFQLNFFNGTAPLSFYIFFNLMIYWLVISILWLLFDVLMYVPNLIHRWIDKAAL